MSVRRWLWSRWICETLGLPLSRPLRARRPPLMLESLEARVTPSMFTVSTLNDTQAVNTAVSPLDSSGNISLRSAIQYIDDRQLTGSNTISFDATIAGGTIYLNAFLGALTLNDTSGSVTIQGPASRITVDGQNGVEDFSLAGSTTVAIDQLTITGGSAINGGGIFNAGSLTLSGSTLTGNTATNGGGLYNTGTAMLYAGTLVSGNSATAAKGSANGGGIFNSSGATLTVSGSTVSKNFARYNGGGIDNAGTATISGGTLLSGNNSLDRGGALTNEVGGALTISGSMISGNSSFAGGGLYAYGYYSGSPLPMVTIDASTLSGNTAHTGGAIDNLGDATISGGSVISGNTAYLGGGIDNDSGDNGSGVLTITGSTITGNTATSRGGGLYNLYSATITDGSIFSDNYAGGASAQNGGGIFNQDSLSVAGSTITGNSAANNGGGIYNYGTATVVDSTLSGNSAADGGGVFNSIGSTLTIADSSLSDNTASSDGGGVENGGTATLTDSTLAGNSAGGTGGGLDNFGTASLFRTSVATNTAATGGGINASGTTSLSSTLVALNTGADPDVSGFITGDHNLIGDGTGTAGITDGVNGNQVGTAASSINPLLAPLGTYGGPTQTMALLPGSPAIDAGGNTGLTSDQRGFPRVVNGVLDIGAVESQGYTLQVFGGDNQSTVFNTAFAQPLVVQVNANNAADPVAGGVVTFTVPHSGPSASLSTSSAVIDSSGLASVTAVANSLVGSYVATASIITSVAFNLTNTTLPPTPPLSPAPMPPSPNCFIISVYLHLLGRFPGDSELVYWTNVFNTLGNTVDGRTELVRDLETSTEYRTDEVNQLYLQYLHRPATGDPLAQAWVDLLGLGWTLEEVAARLVNSSEFILTQTDGSFAGWLNAFYLDALHRPVDQAGLQLWGGAFYLGADFSQIAEAIFTATPLPGQPSNQYRIDLVQGYYPQFLGRSSAGDSQSLNWMSLLQDGFHDQYVIAGILGSTEFYDSSCTYLAMVQMG